MPLPKVISHDHNILLFYEDSIQNIEGSKVKYHGEMMVFSKGTSIICFDLKTRKKISSFDTKIDISTHHNNFDLLEDNTIVVVGEHCIIRYNFDGKIIEQLKLQKLYYAKMS